MADPFQPVRQGDTFGMSARTANGLLRAGQEASRRRQDENQTSNRGPAAPSPPQIYNGLGTALSEFSVLAYGPTPHIDPAAVPFEASAGPIFEAATPATATDPFCITREPIPAGGIGEIVTNGPAVVQVNVTDAAHTRAVPVAGVTGHLDSAATGGVPILTKEAGTGLLFAFVLLGGEASADPDASKTVRGYSSISAQVFAGVKTFYSGIYVGDGTPGSAAVVAFKPNGDPGLASIAGLTGYIYANTGVGGVSGGLFILNGAGDAAYAVNQNGLLYTGLNTTFLTGDGRTATFKGGLLVGLA